MTPPMMIPKQKPENPAPVIAPSSEPVNPNSRPQLSRMPPRMAAPTPAARIAKNPAHSRRLAFGAIAMLLTSGLFGLGVISVCLGFVRLQCEIRELHDGATFEGRLMRAEADAGPVGGLLGIREWVAV